MRIRQRYNPAIALFGLIVMLIGAVIVVTIFALAMNVPANRHWVAIGAGMTALGMMLQLLYGRRHRRSRRR